MVLDLGLGEGSAEFDVVTVVMVVSMQGSEMRVVVEERAELVVVKLKEREVEAKEVLDVISVSRGAE